MVSKMAYCEDLFHSCQLDPLIASTFKVEG